MDKVKDILLGQNRFAVGEPVEAWSYRKCGACPFWFKFRYDDAVAEIEQHGYYRLICPECEREHTYDMVQQLPNQYMKFIEVE